MDFDPRIIVSAGEPLNPGTVTWAEETFGVMMVDHYGFTEGSMRRTIALA